MLFWPVPKGLNEALEPEEEKKEQEEQEEDQDNPWKRDECDKNNWWKGKTLDPHTSPSWQWKLDRQEKSKQEGRNKAGKKMGSGPSSTSRKQRRQENPPKKNNTRESKRAAHGIGKNVGGGDGGKTLGKGISAGKEI